MSSSLNVLVVLKPSDPSHLDHILPNLADWLDKRDHTISFFAHEEERVAKLLGKKRKRGLVQDIEDCDVIVTLGGDGTLLSVLRRGPGEIPIFSVNMGNLGFVTQFGRPDFFENLDLALKHKMSTAEVDLYSVVVRAPKKKPQSYVFVNDAVLSKRDIARVFNASVSTKNETIVQVAGDGVVISSPLGSTAYSLAAGGPVVHPSVKATIVTPICPHGFFQKTIVMPQDQSLFLKPEDTNDQAILTLDGQEAIPIPEKAEVEIYFDQRQKGVLYANPDRQYFATLREKFSNR